MVYISVLGHCPRVSKKIVKEAVQFFANQLMSPRIVATLDITVRFDFEFYKKHKFSGEVEVIDDVFPPRMFNLNLDSCRPRIRMFELIAHEIVHVKQYAIGELKDEYVRNPHKVRFRNEYHYMDEPHEEGWDWDYDTPWEIEAYGREYGLTSRFILHLKKLDMLKS